MRVSTNSDINTEALKYGIYLDIIYNFHGRKWKR